MNAEMQAINVPACGLDVHKDIIEATVIDAEGNFIYKSFDTMRKSLTELTNWILSFGCLTVLMESTGVFWIPIYEMLEKVAGMNVSVGNASHMKNVPGRPKTDKEDSKWIARLCMMGLILPSFIVGPKFRELREFTRYHKKLVQERARVLNRIEKLLQMNGFRLSSVVSSINGVSAMNFLKKLQLNGIVTVEDINQLRTRGLRKSSEEIERAISGHMKFTSRLLLGRMLSRLETLDKEIAEIYELMVKMSKDHAPSIKIIESIPGMAEQSAMYIIAEIGTEMSPFRTSRHLAAWAGLAPKVSESAGKIKSSKTKKANAYVKSILTECAWSAVRSRNTRLSNWYWSNVKRLGQKKAIIAVARKLLVYIYAMLKSGELYDDSLDVTDTETRKAQKLESARNTIVRHSKSAAQKKQCVNEDRKGHTNTPPSAQADSFSEPPIVADTSAPIKKRGRPRKVIISAQDNPGNSLNAENPASPKKRGRPRKKNISADQTA